MVARSAELDGLFCWESTSISKTKDALSGKLVSGVQFTLLSDRLRDYDGRIAVRRLSRDLTDEELLKFRQFRKAVRGRPYEQSRLELARAALDLIGPDNTEDLTSLFCSELLAELYQRLGWLPEPPHGLPSNEYTPKDFAEIIDLQGGVSLGKPIEIAA